MSVVLNGTNQYLRINANPPGSCQEPITISAWIKLNNITNIHPIAAFDDGIADNYLLEARGTIAGDPIAAMVHHAGGAWKIADTTIGYVTGTWYHIVAVFTSDTLRASFIDGDSKGVNQTEQHPGWVGLGYFDIGTYGSIPFSSFAAGKIAEVTCWNVALTDAEIAQLAAGDPPNTIRPLNLKAWWPLFDDPNDIVNGFNLTEYGSPTYDTNDHPSGQRYEYYDTGDNASQALAAPSHWIAQTFTPQVDHIIKKVRLKLHRTNNPGILTVSIKEVDGSGHPTGVDLCSGTLDTSLVTDGSPGRWHEILLGSGATLSASTKYAIVCRCSAADTPNNLWFRHDNSVPSYSGGNYEWSGDSGVSWSTLPNNDLMFIDWGSYEVPVITNQSGDTVKNVGEFVSLFVIATGIPDPTFQWYKNDVEISGETNYIFTVSFYAQESDAGTYKCKASNVAGLDWSDPIILTITQLSADDYILYETDDCISHETELSIDLIHTVSIDLLRLIPEKFWSSEILQDYIDETELFVGNWLTKVRDIVKLLNPNTVGSIDYLRKLGTLIGTEFSPEDETTETKTRKELTHAVEWYKMKGTYQAVQVMAMIQQFTLNIYDMYTNDYDTFYMVDWFVGNESENPPGFDGSYYKSPHFGLEVVLDKVYQEDAVSTSGYTNYLWKSSFLDNLYLHVGRMRPVHTVPHFMLFLNPKTDEFGHVVEVDGNIQAKILGEWEYSTKYFDMTGGDIWYFDSGIYFDQSSESFIKSITKWVLGTGNYPSNIEDPDFVIENPGPTGSIDPDNIIITSEKITFDFIVSKNIEQNGISALGLYVPGSPDKLVVASCFPKIDKDSRASLRVLVEVFKKDLS